MDGRRRHWPFGKEALGGFDRAEAVVGRDVAGRIRRRAIRLEELTDNNGVVSRSGVDGRGDHR